MYAIPHGWISLLSFYKGVFRIYDWEGIGDLTLKVQHKLILPLIYFCQTLIPPWFYLSSICTPPPPPFHSEIRLFALKFPQIPITIFTPPPPFPNILVKVITSYPNLCHPPQLECLDTSSGMIIYTKGSQIAGGPKIHHPKYICIKHHPQMGGGGGWCCKNIDHLYQSNYFPCYETNQNIWGEGGPQVFWGAPIYYIFYVHVKLRISTRVICQDSIS